MTARIVSAAGPALCAALVVGLLGVRTASAAETFTVTYRAAEWKTLEFEDAGKAKMHFETVKKLGCEAKRGDHGGHVDVSYRCPEWKRLSLKDHDAVHRWEKWLKAAGFETKHAH